MAEYTVYYINSSIPTLLLLQSMETFQCIQFCHIICFMAQLKSCKAFLENTVIKIMCIWLNTWMYVCTNMYNRLQNVFFFQGKSKLWIFQIYYLINGNSLGMFCCASSIDSESIFVFLFTNFSRIREHKSNILELLCHTWTSTSVKILCEIFITLWNIQCKSWGML